MKVAYVKLSLSVILLNAFVEWKLAKGNFIFIFPNRNPHIIRVLLKNKHFSPPDKKCLFLAHNYLATQANTMLLPVLFLFKENSFDEYQLIQSN